MWTNATHAAKDVTDYQFRRLMVDLEHGHIQQEVVPCRDLDDFLGGMGRAFRVLEHYDVEDAYAPDAPLVMNLGGVLRHAADDGLARVLLRLQSA